MAKKREEEPPKGSPAWMATFSDLMNLLLCFFVLLFSMSSVDAQKFELIASSFSQSFSIFTAGATAIGDGMLVSMGVSQLNELDDFTSSMGKTADGQSDEMEDLEKMTEALDAEKLKQSEELAEKIEEAVEEQELGREVDMEVTSQGHTDNVPINSARFANNNELSSARALSVFDYFIDTTTLNPAMIKHSGRGEYVPIADNSNPEGRAKNRRVEIKIYHTLSAY